MSVKERDARPAVVIERTFRARVEELWELWTTKDGFESWWGPEGFRVEVHEMDAREGGRIHYDMIADTPEMVEAMREMGSPDRHETRGWFEEIQPPRRIVLKHVIDFLPGVEPYESTMMVELHEAGEHARMVVTLQPMHDAETSGMQREGFTSQLTKLERRFGVVA